MADDPILHNDRFELRQANFCALPGYLILRLAGPARSLGELDEATAAALGALLTRAARALEEVAGADRVYVLSFAEVDRQLHFHLLPRSSWLAEAFRLATGAGAGPIDGPRLFQWVREVYLAATDLPPAAPDPVALLARVRSALTEA